MKRFLLPACLVAALFGCRQTTDYDVIIHNGTIYDGSGKAPVTCDVAIKGDTIAAMGDLKMKTAATVVDATGLAVAPGFINMLSWANESLIEDGRSLGDIMQGVTLEVMGEGTSEGPLNDAIREARIKKQGDIKYDIPWTTLREYLDFLVKRGVSCNVASFIGATSVRANVVGYADRKPTPEEMERMKKLVRDAMEEGAVGLGSSLIYPPAFYASTEELIELAKVAAEYDGMYISHMRSEGDQLMAGLDELLRITKEAGIRSEIYHLKAAGEKNWPKMDRVIERIDSARAAGLKISANMYTYTAAATGLGACFPPWVQEGGNDEWMKRLRDSAIRARIREEIGEPADNWENFYDLAGSPERILLVGFVPDSLKKYTAKTLAEVASLKHADPLETLLDLVLSNGQDVGAVYFLMSEENVKKQIALPWMSFGSDAESEAPEGVFLKSDPHPRAYGNFTRLLGKYVRDEKVIPLQEAVRRLTSLPAGNLRLDRRGLLKSGYFADIVVFNPDSIADHATFLKPHQLSTGMRQVFVNGRQVVKNGVHTGLKPGRVVVRTSRGMSR